MNDVRPPAAVNPLPPVIAALFLVIMGVEVVFWLGSKGIIGGPTAVGWRLDYLQRFAFSVPIFEWMWTNGQWPAEHAIRFVSYMFIHGGFTHALFSGVLVLALGKMVGDNYGSVRTLIVFLVSGVVGAFAFGILLDTPLPLLGAYPGAYGLIGAYTYLLLLRSGHTRRGQIQAFRLIGFLMGIQLIFGLLFGGRPDWVADLSGFATGFLISFIIAPGGWAKIRERLRHD